MDETYNNDTSCIELCNIHNDEYVVICECNRMYCKKCEDLCNKSHPKYTIGAWKKQVLIEMQKSKDRLTNKLKVLNIIIEMIMNNHNSIIKQIEDIIPSLSSDAT